MTWESCFRMRRQACFHDRRGYNRSKLSREIALSGQLLIEGVVRAIRGILPSQLPKLDQLPAEHCPAIRPTLRCRLDRIHILTFLHFTSLASMYSSGRIFGRHITRLSSVHTQKLHYPFSNAFTRTASIPTGSRSSRRYTTMAPLTTWSRLIRYVSKDGSIKYGEPVVSDSKPDIDALAKEGKLKVKVLDGTTFVNAKPTGEEDEVKSLLGPLRPQDVPIVRCVGLNYRTHSMSSFPKELHDADPIQSSKPASTSPRTPPSSRNPPPP